MPMIQTVELELEVLEKQKAAIEAEMELALWEYRTNMPTAHPHIDDGDLFGGSMTQWRWEIAKLDTAIAEKRLELFQSGGRDS